MCSPDFPTIFLACQPSYSLKYRQPLSLWVSSLFCMQGFLSLAFECPIQVQFGSAAQSCPTLCHPWTAARKASLSITNSLSLLKFMSIESVMPSNHLIFCCRPLLPPSIFPSIRVLCRLVNLKFISSYLFNICWMLADNVSQTCLKLISCCACPLLLLKSSPS